MKLLCLLNLYIDIGTRYIPNMKISAVHCRRGIYLSVYIILLCLFV